MAPTNNSNAIRMKAYRAKQNVSQRNKRLENNRLRNATNKKKENVQQKTTRLMKKRNSAKKTRAIKAVMQQEKTYKTIPKKKKKKAINKNNLKQYTNSKKSSKLFLEAFNYDETKEYDKIIFIGQMTQICVYCQALKYEKESPGMCCMNGKIVLPKLNEPPQFMLNYLYGKTQESKHFMKNIRKYNSTFQMTSFGATKIFNQENYLPTFKIQGQAYHIIGSLLPEKVNDSKFLQIYFIGDEQSELN